MAIFKFYNVQLLPNQKELGNIKSDGYKKIFLALSNDIKKSIEKGTLESISYSLRNDFFIAPISLDIKDDIGFGYFLKYDEVSTVVGTLDDEEKYVSSGGDSSKKYNYRFVYDFGLHILAVEVSKGLPSASVLSEFIEKMIEPYRQDFFPVYEIKVIEMTEADSLEHVFEEAIAFKRVDVDLTYSNSEDWIEGMSEELMKKYEQEMKDKSIDTIEHTEKSSKKGSMKQLSESAMAYLGLACKFGNASITYKNEVGATKHYHMVQYPIKKRVNDFLDDRKKTALEFALDVKEKIKNANEVVKKANKIFKELRKGPKK